MVVDTAAAKAAPRFHAWRNPSRAAREAESTSMFHRLAAIFLLWSLRFGLTWLIAHECLTLVIEKFDAVSHALSSM